MKKGTIILLTGKVQGGKMTVAQHLVSRHEYKWESFVRPLKQAICEIMGTGPTHREDGDQCLWTDLLLRIKLTNSHKWVISKAEFVDKLILEDVPPELTESFDIYTVRVAQGKSDFNPAPVNLLLGHDGTIAQLGHNTDLMMTMINEGRVCHERY